MKHSSSTPSSTPVHSVSNPCEQTCERVGERTFIHSLIDCNQNSHSLDQTSPCIPPRPPPPPPLRTPARTWFDNLAQSQCGIAGKVESARSINIELSKGQLMHLLDALEKDRKWQEALYQLVAKTPLMLEPLERGLSG